MTAASSSYKFTPSGSYGGGALVVTEGASSVTLDIASSPKTISGNLTAQPVRGRDRHSHHLHQWRGAIAVQSVVVAGSFFNTSSGSVNGEDYASRPPPTAARRSGWRRRLPRPPMHRAPPTTTPIVLATQDWLGDIQPEMTIATDNNFVDPFVNNNLSAGNLGAATIFSSNSTQGQGGIVYWTALATAADYAVDFEPLTVSYPSSPPSSNLVTITGSPVTMISAITNPMNWTFDVASSSSLVFAYMAQDTSTTENLYMEGFNASGAATNSGPVLIASNLPDGTPYYSRLRQQQQQQLFWLRLSVSRSRRLARHGSGGRDAQYDHRRGGTPDPVPLATGLHLVQRYQFPLSLQRQLAALGRRRGKRAGRHPVLPQRQFDRAGDI